MSISAAEIGQIIKHKIADFDAPVVSAESGVITSLGDGIAQVYGLERAMEGELLAFPHDLFGMALNLEEDQVRAIILGRFEELHRAGELPRRRCAGLHGQWQAARRAVEPLRRLLQPLSAFCDHLGADDTTVPSQLAISIPYH